MSASEAGLAGGIVGGFIGSFFGPLGTSIGFALGSAAGGALGSKPPGPQLSVAKFNGSSYGTMLDIVIGTDRRAGTIIEVQDPDVQQPDSGKGGSSSNGRATETFAIALHDGEIVSVLAVWADGGIELDTRAGSTFNNGLPVTFYLGTGTQMPDPTLEAIHGVGNVPAYRHTAYAVFNALDITRWGRIPNLNFLICEKAGTIPWRVSTYTRLNTGSTFGGIDYNSNAGQTTNRLFEWNSGEASPVTVDTEVRNLDGTLVSSSTDLVATINGSNVFNMAACQNKSSIWYQTVSGISASENGWLVGNAVAGIHINGSGSFDQVYHHMTFDNDVLYVLAGFNVPQVRKHICTGGFPAISASASYSLPTSVNSGNYRINVGDDGLVYVGAGDGTVFLSLDSDLNLVHDWGADGPPIDASGFMVYKGQILYHSSLIGGESMCTLATINGGDTFTFVGQIPCAVGDIIALGDGYASVADGIVSINPPPALVTYEYAMERLSDLSGLDGTQYNATELTQPMYGYTISGQMPCQSAAQPLMALDQFDGVERAGVQNFVRRGHDPVATIPDSDLGAIEEVGTPSPRFTVVRAQEEDLPRQLNITYPNIAADYQPNTQYARIEAADSQSIITMPVAVILDDNTAIATAQTLLYNSRMEREEITFATSRKYAYLEPTDCVIVHGYTVRITDVTYMANGVVEFKARPTNFGLWLRSSPTGGAAAGFKPRTHVPTVLPTFVILDIPKIRDDDFEVGLYVASSRAATLYKSSDGGTAYVSVGTLSATVMGLTASILGSWAGGNYLDPSTSVSVVVQPGQELESVTDLALVNGANLCCIGRELLQFKNATLIATDTYLLDGFLRARFGTDTIGHLSGEPFVMLPATNIASSIAELNQVRYYKAVSAGQSLSLATPLSLVNTGVSLRPYSVVSLTGGPNGAADILVTWIRRTRTGGAWADFVDAALGEASEQYVLQVWNATFSVCARVVTGLTSPTFTYTAAMQTTDFGAHQQTAYVTVGQLGQIGLGVQTPAAIPGGGSTVDSVLAPVSPFGFVPVVPPSGPTVPSTAATLTWPGPSSVTNIGFSPGTTWDITFTPAVGKTAFTFEAAEYAGDGSGPVSRTGVMSLSLGGPPILPSCSAVGNTISFFGFMAGNPAPGTYPTLAYGVPVYVRITTSAISSMYANLTTH